MGDHPARAEPSAHIWFASREEVLEALNENAIAFPAAAIPAGAEHDDEILCRVVRTPGDLTEDLVALVLEHAYPLNGRPRFQLIGLSQDSSLLAGGDPGPFSLTN